MLANPNPAVHTFLAFLHDGEVDRRAGRVQQAVAEDELVVEFIWEAAARPVDLRRTLADLLVMAGRGRLVERLANDLDFPAGLEASVAPS